MFQNLKGLFNVFTWFRLHNEFRHYTASCVCMSHIHLTCFHTYWSSEVLSLGAQVDEKLCIPCHDHTYIHTHTINLLGFFSQFAENNSICDYIHQKQQEPTLTDKWQKVLIIRLSLCLNCFHSTSYAQDFHSHILISSVISITGCDSWPCRTGMLGLLFSVQITWTCLL